MLNQKWNLATSYTAPDGYSSRAAPARASRPSPPSLREVGGLHVPRGAQENVEDWGE